MLFLLLIILSSFELDLYNNLSSLIIEFVEFFCVSFSIVKPNDGVYWVECSIGVMKFVFCNSALD